MFKMRILILAAFTLPFIIISPLNSSAKTITVDDDGLDVQDADFNSIQEAIVYAEEGDIILVYPGLYSAIQVDKKLILKGAGDLKPTISGNGNKSAVTIRADGVIFESFFVTESASWLEAGIKIISKNCTIRNNIISGNEYYGILLYYSSGNNIVEGNEIRNNYYGIAAYYSKNNSILNNTVFDNFYGIAFYSRCNSNRILDNTVYRNIYGIFLESSSYNTLKNNRLFENDFNFGVWGRSFSDFQNEISKSNTIDGKPVLYLVNASDAIITDAGTVYLIKCKNITVKNLEIANNINGIFLFQTTGSSIENNKIRDAWYGIKLQSSCAGNSITKNVIERCDFGIHVSSSSSNLFYLNSVFNNTKNTYSYNSLNLWNSTFEIEYIYNSTNFTGYLGNFWDDYRGNDTDGDGVGEDVYPVDSGYDWKPLVIPVDQLIFRQKENEKEEVNKKQESTRNDATSGSGRGGGTITTPVPLSTTKKKEETLPDAGKLTPPEVKKVSLVTPAETEEAVQKISPIKKVEDNETRYRPDEGQTAVFGIVSALITALILVLYLLKRK